MPKISVIIPVYNVEKYLRECLDSVINQTLQDIEIICVNDGSTDSSLEILKEYAEKDVRIKVITQKNNGYCSAMDVGINEANGEYVGIVHPEDYVDINMYKLLYQKSRSTNSDIVKALYYNIEFVNNETNEYKASTWLVNIAQKYENNFTLKDEPCMINYAPSIWSAIYKSSWIKNYNLKFKNNITNPSNDLFALSIYTLMPTISILVKPLYYHRILPKEQNCINYINSATHIRKFLLQNDIFTADIREYFWEQCYNKLKYFYKSNKYCRDFYVQIRNFLILAQKDNCVFKKFGKQDIKEYNNICKYNFYLYNIRRFVKKSFRMIFSVTNEKDKRHKSICIFGIKVKIPTTPYKYSVIIKILDTIIPKDKNKIVFLSFPDFSDNAKEYYEYLNEYHKNKYSLIWIYQSRINKDYKHIEEKYFINSFMGLWNLLTAKYIVYTGWAIASYLNFKHHKLIELWHGMPLKTLGFIEKNIPDITLKQYTDIGKQGYFFVSSDVFKLSMVSCFLMNPNKVFITGQSKTDCILTDRNKNEIVEFIHYHKYDKVVIYAPTYKEAIRNNRRDIDSEFHNIFYCEDYCEDSFLDFLEKHNVLFIIKPHPFDEWFYRKIIAEGNLFHKNIKVIFNNDMSQNNLYFYDFFKFADLLITDFSSIAIDYLITKKPVIFLNAVSEQYSKNRGFILEDNYEILMPGEKVDNFKKLLLSMEDALTVDTWKEKRLSMLPLLYKYFDSNSSARIYEVMKGL